MQRVVLVLSAALVLAGSAAAAAATPYLIQSDTRVGGLAVGHATLPVAQARFGKASYTAKTDVYNCFATWKPIGLSLEFLKASSKNGCVNGVLTTATMTNRASWRTMLGLRVGDSAARVKQLYPKAKLYTSATSNNPGYWLIVRRTCKAAGGDQYPSLLAELRRGKVSALVVDNESACA